MERVEVNGVKLEIQRIESAAGRPRAPIVFLHEGLGSVAMWRDWPRQVCAATGRAGVVYSRRGYGASDSIPDVRGAGRHKPDYMHREALEVLPALLRALAIEKPVLLGHSDGGTISLIHAAQFPVQACVVMAPHVMVEDISIVAIDRARKAYLEEGLGERLKRYHVDVECAFWQWNEAWGNPAFRAFDIRPECRRITAPVLAMQGREDGYGTLRQIEEIAPTRGPLELAVIEDCGHSPYRDQPEVSQARIVQFLSALA
jgi:pimeloyl-ACP methyl ester carboxylesterase